MDRARFVYVTLLSMTLIALELIWTRIFSAEFFYTFAFLTISLAMLGLGLGALVLHLVPALNTRRAFGAMLAATGLLTLAGPVIIFRLGLNFAELFSGLAMIGIFQLTVTLLSAAFFCGGVALAGLFKNNHQDMPRLYMADLLGAGLGVVLAIAFMNVFGTPAAVFLAALPVLVAALVACRRWGRLIPAVLIALALGLAPAGDTLLRTERQERGPILHEHWDATGRIKVFAYDDEVWGLNIDNAAHSPIYRFDGNWDRPDSLRYRFGIDVSWLIARFDSCRFLSLGAGGGVDVLQALQAGATEIHAVEVVPYLNKMLVDGYLTEFSGGIYNDPRVIVATEDARAYVRRHDEAFDLIYSLSSNSFAALASGSFALAENYLFTTEAFADYWRALSDDGFLMMEHQFYMPRLVSELMEALAGLGVKDPARHFAVYALPRMRRQMLLLSKRSLTDEIRRNAFGPLDAADPEDIHLLHPAPPAPAGSMIDQIVTAGWRAVADTAVIDVTPCSDDRPFVAQMGTWRYFRWDRLKGAVRFPLGVFGFPIAKIIVVTILLVAVVLVIPLNLLPYLRRDGRLRAVPWLYFFTIGLAFMVVEVVLIQQYTFFVGPSVYSVAIILLTLLVTSGIGSRFAPRVPDGVAFPAIAVWLLLDVTLFRRLVGGLTEPGLAARILITALLVAPVGFFMGMPFPKGARRVGALIDWGFAVNGVASVIGATAILLVAFAHGFTAALLVGAVLYLLAWALLRAARAW
ncbi:MAG: hypothetical protein JW819_09125 [Candidatus Krumholzibacteriota bacterium]|nr:hypothetical protein [Candidatus Krumholzibacteriota bacterium]